MNPYRHFVSEFARLAREGRKCVRSAALLPCPVPPRARKRAPGSLFSLHPDDESIGGGLALRLMRECRWNVLNVAVTLGSKRERRPERRKELKGACQFLGFDLLLPAAAGWKRSPPRPAPAIPNFGRNMSPSLRAFCKSIVPERSSFHMRSTGTPPTSVCIGW